MASWVIPKQGIFVTDLEKIHYLFFFRFCILRITVGGLTTVGDNIFDTLKLNEWSVMCGPGCKMFLLNLSVSPLEYTDREVVPYLVIVGIQSPISALRLLIFYYVCRA